MAETSALRSKGKLGRLHWGGMAVAGLRYHLSPPHPGCRKYLMADERGEPAPHFDFYGRAGRRGQDDDGGDQLAQRPYRLASGAYTFGRKGPLKILEPAPIPGKNR